MKFGWVTREIDAPTETLWRLGDVRCRAGFGAPWPVAPYRAVCRRVLIRLDRLAVDEFDMRGVPIEAEVLS